MMTDSLDCWPSDHAKRSTLGKKHNLVEFYHQILWASQSNDQQQTNKKGCRVSFSSEPPTIHEYEPEYNKSKLIFLDYQIFRKRSQHHSQHLKDEQHQFLSSKQSEKDIEESNDSIEKEYLDHQPLATRRSISEFQPIRNSQYRHQLGNRDSSTLPYSFKAKSTHVPLAQINMLYTEMNFTAPYLSDTCNKMSAQDEPLPRYSDSADVKDIKHPEKIQECGGKGPAFFQRTLQKFRSSPKLKELQRRSSVATLRRKMSFSTIGIIKT